MRRVFQILPIIMLAGSASANQAPVVDSIFTQPSAKVAPGATVVIEVNAHDPDCSGTCTPGGWDSCGKYIRADMLQWTATGGKLQNIYSTPSSSPFYTRAEWVAPLTSGAYTISVFLADSGGMLCGGRKSTTVNIPVSVVTGEPPSVSAFIAQPSWVSPGEKVKLTVIASDDRDAPSSLTFIFTSSGGYFDAPDPSRPWERMWNAPQLAGLYSINVEVRDSDGNSVIKTVNVKVQVLYPAGNISGERDVIVPSDVAVSQAGDVVVTDSEKSRIFVYDSALQKKKSFYLRGVLSADAGENGDVWAVTSNGCLVHLSDKGKVINENCGFLTTPLDVKYVSFLGKVFVADASGSIRAFDAHGTYAGEITGARKPVAVDYLENENKLVVADAETLKILIYTPDGVLVNSWGVQGNGDGQLLRPHGISHDGTPRIYVTDSYLDRIEIFDVSGNYLGSAGVHGSSLGQLMSPCDIAVDRFGRVFVASTGNGRVEVYTLCRGDSDCDGMDDAYEKSRGLGYLNPADASLDPDHDGLSTQQEYSLGTDPFNSDTDGDGVSDGVEVARGLNPLSPEDNIPVAVIKVYRITDGPGRVTLDASSSADPNGDPIVAYEWRQTGGPEIVLDGVATEEIVKVVLKKAGTYTFSLRVSDGKAWSKEESMNVHVANVKPDIYAPPFYMVKKGESILLNPAVYDANGDEVWCTWQSEVAPEIEDPDKCWVNLRAEKEGVYTYRLILSDGENIVDKEVKLVVWADDVLTPMVKPEVRYESGKIELNAEVYGSLPNGATFTWRVEEPNNVTTFFKGHSVEFEPSAKGIYTVKLSAPWAGVLNAETYVNVCGENAPFVSAGKDIVVNVGDEIVVEPALSGVNNPIITWRQLEGPPVGFVQNNSALEFTPTVRGTYTFMVMVRDTFTGCEAYDKARITVLDEDDFPVVNASDYAVSATNFQINAGGNARGIVWVPQSGGIWISNSTAFNPEFHVSSQGLYALLVRGLDADVAGGAVHVNFLVSYLPKIPEFKVQEGNFVKRGEKLIIPVITDGSIPLSPVWNYNGGDLPQDWWYAGSFLFLKAGEKGEEYYFTVSDKRGRAMPQNIWVGVADAGLDVMKGENITLQGDVEDVFVKSIKAQLTTSGRRTIGLGFSLVEGDEKAREIMLAPSGEVVSGSVEVVYRGAVAGVSVLKIAGVSRVPVDRFTVSGNKVLFNVSSTGRYLVKAESVEGASEKVSFSSGSHYGCIIAGVSRGYYDDGFLNSLRKFRDRFLSRWSAGRLIVHTYYRLSKRYYPEVMKNKYAKEVVRVLLYPIYLTWKYGISLLPVLIYGGTFLLLLKGRRRCSSLAVLIALLLFTHARALALDPPHDTLTCNDCHTLHNAPGLTLTSSWGNWYLCFSCHSQGNIAFKKPLGMNFRAVPGERGNSHSFDVSVINPAYGSSTPTNPELKDRLDGDKITCSTCHDQHSQSNTPFDPSAPGASGSAGRHFQRINNDQNQMCLDCHSARNMSDVTTYTGSPLSHPVGVPFDPATYPNLSAGVRDFNGAFQSGARFEIDGTGDTNPTNNLVLDSAGNVNCMSCHGVHYTDGNPYTVDRP